MAAEAVPHAQLGAVGIFWIVFACSWTLILALGMAFLYVRRDIPMLRIRGLPLSFGAIVLLHMYWLCVQIGYVYGPVFPPAAEYWIMGIWLPFGVALFHASNSRFLYVAKAQKRFVPTGAKKLDDDEISIKSYNRRTIVGVYKSLDYTNKMLVLVCAGMAFQLFLTTFMFVISRKFHRSFGISGTEVYGTASEQKAEMSRGWEWWPSVFWQFFWAWIVAPMILWQSRRLSDTQGWRLQTIACCLANLHATPMWLVALYVPAMAPVNQYFIPPQWLAISIMMLEIFTVFIPVWEVLKQNTLAQETIDSIARWEARQKSSTHCEKSLHSRSTVTSWLPRVGRASSIKTNSGASILTMDALEHTLSKNPEPLQEFSALKDFSGENIAFLTRVKQWRTAFPAVKLSEKTARSTTVARESFEFAVRIYMDFISARSAEFQINLSSPDFKKLEIIFEAAALSMYGDKQLFDPATPFDDLPVRKGSAPSSAGSEDAIVPCKSCGGMSSSEPPRFSGDIPSDFDETVFDDAEMSIKYLVLTNTWPKFIKERKSFDSLESLESGR